MASPWDPGLGLGCCSLMTPVSSLLLTPVSLIGEERGEPFILES